MDNQEFEEKAKERCFQLLSYILEIGDDDNHPITKECNTDMSEEETFEITYKHFLKEKING